MVRLSSEMRVALLLDMRVPIQLFAEFRVSEKGT